MDDRGKPSGFGDTIAAAPPPAPTPPVPTVPGVHPGIADTVAPGGDPSVAMISGTEGTMMAPSLAATATSTDALAAIRAATDLPTVARTHYDMIAEHARGGLGRIVRARDRRTGRQVAIKEMLGDNDELARRFAQEALITANLQHPSIVPVYELGKWPTGEPFYAMKLVAGKSFEQAIRDGGGALRDRIAELSVIVSVAEALAYAHSRGVIHRDLKPANVLVGDHGETVVIDWGLAKVVGVPDPELAHAAIPTPSGPVDPGQTVAGAVMGTPSYMPPEQARGVAVDERADVYAIGAMLYFLIAGAAPFADQQPGSVVAALALAAAGAPTPLNVLQPTAPPDLVAIANRAMAREPGDRYPTAGELAADLRRFTTGQLVSAHRYDLRTLLMRWIRRHRVPLTVAAVLISVLVVGAVYSVQKIVMGRRAAIKAQHAAESERQTAEREKEDEQKALGDALFQKGRLAEDTHEWARAAMYYAAARLKHDTAEAKWAAGYAEARAVYPQARHQGHTSWVHAIAIAPDGSRVASVDDAGELRVWAPADGALIARLPTGHPLYAVAWAPGGTELAISGDDGVIHRLSLDLKPVADLTGAGGRVWSIAYSPDGTLLASGGEDSIARLWTLATGAHRELRAHTQRVYSVAFSPDGKRLATGSDDRRVWLWDVATGKGEQLGAHIGGGIRVALFVPRGDRVVTLGWDSMVHVWRIGDPDPAWSWPDSHSVHGGSISPDGTLLAAGGDGDVIHVWELGTREMVTSLDLPGGQTSAIAFSRDGHWMITAGRGNPPTVWDATALGRLAAGGHHFSVDRVAFSPSGQRLVSGSNRERTVREWETATGHELVRITTDSACGDGAVPIGEDQIASACEDATLRRWDSQGRETGKLTTDVWLRTTSVSPDLMTLAAGHLRGRLALIDIPSWRIKLEATLHAHQIYVVDLRGDGRLLTAGLDSHTRVWRASDLSPELDVDLSEHDGLLAAAMSPDGKQIASGAEDGTIAVWDVAIGAWFDHGRGAHIARLPKAWRILYAPDGAHAYTASEDGLVRIWDTTTWAEPGKADTLDSKEGDSHALGVSPDGQTIAVGYKTGAIVLWDVATRAVRLRIGGSSRDQPACDQLDRIAWVDDSHRDIVTAACGLDPAAYAERLAKRTHQRLDAIDVHWDWEPTR